MRIYAGGIIQETNTFCPNRTELDLFRRGYLLQGLDIEQQLSGTNTEFAGFFEYLGHEPEVEVIPGLAAWAVASGVIEKGAFDFLCSSLIGILAEALPLDGVLLALHGSMVSEDVEDCEGEILRRVRLVVGPDVPIVCTLDYHACVTSAMVEVADVLVGFRTYPHIDFFDTGVRAAQALLSTVRRPIRAHKAYMKLPMILPVENTETAVGPMSTAMRMIESLDTEPGVLSASLFCPQPWVDVCENGVAVLVYSDSESVASAGAREVAGLIWSWRNEFIQRCPSTDELFQVLDESQRPVAIVDSGDITSAGGSGDSTELLRLFLSRDAKWRVIIPIVSSTATNRAFDIGLHNEGQIIIGSGAKGEYNEAVCVAGRIAALSDARVRVGGTSFSGIEIDTGRRAVVEVDGGISILLCEHTSLIHDPEVLRSMGLAPESYDVIVQKSHKLFRPAYKDIVRSIVVLDTPGHTTMHLADLPFIRIKRPIFPLDAI